MRRLALPLVLFPGLLPLILIGCKESYSPNTYAASAAQAEATVERGVIIGVRQVLISANGTIGAAAGGAAGGVAGAQVAGSPVVTAMGAIGGTLVGGIAGSAAAQAASDTKGWEYIVQEDGNKLVSVTQTSKISLPIGLHVLVIAGSQQARIVPDYTVQIAASPPPAKPAATSPAKTPAAPNGSATFEVNIPPPTPETAAAAPFQVAPSAVANDPPTPSAPSPTSTAAAAAASTQSPATKTIVPASTATPAKPAPATTTSPPPANFPAAATP